jgi:hypothetical protein
MVAADFLDLQQKSYVMLNPDEEDWRKLKLQSISIKQLKATRGSVRRDFSAGEYGGEHQEIPEKFGIIEAAIAELISKANSTGAHTARSRHRSGLTNLPTKPFSRLVSC